MNLKAIFILNIDISFNLCGKDLKLSVCSLEVHVKGSVSQILY